MRNLKISLSVEQFCFTFYCSPGETTSADLINQSHPSQELRLPEAETTPRHLTAEDADEALEEEDEDEEDGDEAGAVGLEDEEKPRKVR